MFRYRSTSSLTVGRDSGRRCFMESIRDLRKSRPWYFCILGWENARAGEDRDAYLNKLLVEEVAERVYVRLVRIVRDRRGELGNFGVAPDIPDDVRRCSWLEANGQAEVDVEVPDWVVNSKQRYKLFIEVWR